MADLAMDNPPLEPRPKRSSTSILLPPLLLLGAMFMGADFTAISLGPLRALGIAYPGWIEYSHMLIPGACAIIWLLLLRRWPNAGAILAVLLCFAAMPFIPRFIESRVAKVPVTRWIEPDDMKALEVTVGVPVTEQGSRDGTFVIVAPSNEQHVRTELSRLKLLGGPAAE